MTTKQACQRFIPRRGAELIIPGSESGGQSHKPLSWGWDWSRAEKGERKRTAAIPEVNFQMDELEVVRGYDLKVTRVLVTVYFMIAFVAFDFIGLVFSAQIRATLRMTSHQRGTYR